MATKEQLEKNIFWRISKVTYILIALLVLGVTGLIGWESAWETNFDAAGAYAVCVEVPSSKIELTDSERQSIERHYAGKFSWGEDKRIVAMCNSMVSDANNHLYSYSYDNYVLYDVQKSNEIDWSFWFWSLGIELLIFWAIRLAGFYIFGGKEALSEDFDDNFR